MARPEASTLRVIVRAPLAAMRDINFPMRDSARYLDIPRSTALLNEAATTWIANAIQVFENDSLVNGGHLVATRISLPSDRSFASFESAAANLRGPPLPAQIDLPWQQAMLDVEIDYSIGDARSRFSISPELAR